MTSEGKVNTSEQYKACKINYGWCLVYTKPSYTAESLVLLNSCENWGDKKKIKFAVVKMGLSMLTLKASVGYHWTMVLSKSKKSIINQ